MPPPTRRQDAASLTHPMSVPLHSVSFPFVWFPYCPFAECFGDYPELLAKSV